MRRHVTAYGFILLNIALEDIGSNVFYGCTSLQSVELPKSSAKTFSMYHVFENCSSLKSITILEYITDIQPNSFNGCTALESLTIAGSETFIYDAFRDCPLRTITCLSAVPPSVIYYNERFVEGQRTYKGPFNEETVRTCELIVPEGAEDNYLKGRGDRALWRAFLVREVEIPQPGYVVWGTPFNVKVPDGVTVYMVNGKGDYAELTKLNTTVLTDYCVNTWPGVMLYKPNGGKINLEYTEEQCPEDVKKTLAAVDYRLSSNIWKPEKPSYPNRFRFNASKAQFEKIDMDDYIDTYEVYLANQATSNTSIPIKFAREANPPT